MVVIDSGFFSICRGDGSLMKQLPQLMQCPVMMKSVDREVK
jgi:hypothetical protein